MSEPSAAEPSVAEPDPKRKIALVIVLFAAFMDLLDSTIVNIAIPSVQTGLKAGYAEVQWVVAAYLLAFAVFLILGGRLGDMYGRKKLFLVGVAAFTVTSALCGFAQSPEMLIASRALQGAAAALMVPQVLSIITATFPPKERGAALGAFGGIAGLATVGGPVIGAVLINADPFGAGWRIIFLINIPVGILLFTAAAAVVRDSRSAKRVGPDVPGTALLAVGLLLLLFPLVEGRELGWPAWSFVSIAASVPVLVVFAFHQRRRSASGRSSIIVPSLFRGRSFSAGLIANIIFFAVTIGHFLIFIIFLQTGLGFSTLRAGLTGLPWSFGVSFGAAFSATVLTVRFGRKVMLLGAVLLATGLGGIALTVQVRGDAIGSWSLLPTLLVGGLGMGMIIAPILDFILSDVPAEHSGAGSGVVNASQQIGGAVGIAVVGGMFLAFLGGIGESAAKDVTPQLRAELTKVSVAAPRQDEIAGLFNRCFSDRTRANDPGAPQANCERLDGLTDARSGAAVGAAATDARRIAFSHALQRTILFQIGLTVVVFLLLLLLPRVSGHHGDPDDGGTGQVPGQASPSTDVGP
ncbi:MFS transporter [Streptomyces scopuliridis]|uniref:MFS transporter n=1 Tax=Streptomyces scopuliridis TaxID=452529 RepID=UPI0036BBD341